MKADHVKTTATTATTEELSRVETPPAPGKKLRED